MKIEELLQKLKGLPTDTDIDIDPSIVPSAEPPTDPSDDPPAGTTDDPPVKFNDEPSVKNDQTVTMTAADFMRAIEALIQKQQPNDDKKKKEKNDAEVFLY